MIARGRVESVNVAVVRTDLPTTAPTGRSGIDKRSVGGPVLLAESGVEGDTVVHTKHHGGPDQAVYAYGWEDLQFWSAELGQDVRSGGVGENLTVSGVDCSGAVLGERWRVGEAVLQVRSARIPCRVFAAFRGVPDLIKRFTAAGRPGAYFAVLRPGRVQVGDAVVVLDRPDHGVTVAELLAAATGTRVLVPRIVAARDDLGVRDRRWVDRILATARE